MQWNIPGTVLTVSSAETDQVESRISSMFLAGGMVLSQVASVTGLEPYTVQNWVRRGFLSKPVQKRYTLRQLCRIITINMLKSVLPMEQICGLLGYVNGQLDDESDDLIDDAALYFMFVRVASQSEGVHSQQEWEDLIEKVMQQYREPVPGGKERVKKVLAIMCTAWISSRLRSRAEAMLTELNQTEKEN